MVKRLKQASILNLSFAVAASPMLLYTTQLDGNAAKGTTMSAILRFFGGGTTAMLNWVSSTYVLTLKAKPGSNSLIAETPTLLGGSRKTEFECAEIQRPTNLLTTLFALSRQKARVFCTWMRVGRCTTTPFWNASRKSSRPLTPEFARSSVFTLHFFNRQLLHFRKNATL